jgi:glycosyltransferase involved in cell wall biosynthesis
MDNRVYAKYLKRIKSYPLEPCVPHNKFRAAVVIPALNESCFLPNTLKSLADNSVDNLQQIIVVVVVNSFAGAAPDKIEDNARVLKALRDKDQNFCRGLVPGENLFWIDANSSGFQISDKGGVGEARKIGFDNSLNALAWREDARPLLFCLDADTTVAPNYLEEVFKYFDSSTGINSGVVNFRHCAGGNEQENAAIILYELFMRYYVLGLRYAHSPYAHYALGSATVCTAECYVRVGGMRTRNGGEDFYFIQAASKFGQTGSITGTTVYPATRPSDRVPFGTGPKIRDIVEGHGLLFYNPAVFDQLKNVMALVERYEHVDDFVFLPEHLKEGLPEECSGFFEKYDFGKVWQKIFKNTRRDTEYLKAAFYTWFDAFRTLKFIHYLEGTFEQYHRSDALFALNSLLAYFNDFDIKEYHTLEQILEFLRYKPDICPK